MSQDGQRLAAVQRTKNDPNFDDLRAIPIRGRSSGRAARQRLESTEFPRFDAPGSPTEVDHYQTAARIDFMWRPLGEDLPESHAIDGLTRALESPSCVAVTSSRLGGRRCADFAFRRHLALRAGAYHWVRTSWLVHQNLILVCAHRVTTRIL